MQNISKSYSEGVRAAQKAIDAGVPRWIETTGLTYGQYIHPDTGLPIMSLSCSPELDEHNRQFANGNNDEVSAAVKSGAIDVDFRPLLMDIDESLDAIEKSSLGVLSHDHPVIQSADGVVVIELRRSRTKSKSSGRSEWICYAHEEFGTWPKYSVYEGPTLFALAKEGRVLVSKFKLVLSTYDVATTQVLNTFLLR